MAHKKGAGSSRNGRESHSKRLGIKLFGGEKAIAGNIIVRQRGTKHHPEVGVGIGRDHTLFALVDGRVFFKKKVDNKSYVSILAEGAYLEKIRKSDPGIIVKTEVVAKTKKVDKVVKVMQSKDAGIEDVETSPKTDLKSKEHKKVEAPGKIVKASSESIKEEDKEEVKTKKSESKKAEVKKEKK